MKTGINEHFVFSASNLQTFKTCRFKFSLRYIKKIPWPAQITLDSLEFEADREVGIRFHRLIHQYFLGFDISRLENHAMHDPDPRMINWFHIFMKSPYAMLSGELYPEKEMRCTLKDINLIAKYDLLQFENGYYTLYDWKTSKIPPSPKTLISSVQSQLYPLVLSKIYELDKPARFVYWEIAQPNRAIVFNIAIEELTQYENNLLGLCKQIKTLEMDEFEKTDIIKRCAFCEYRSYCGRGVQAAPLDQSEEFDLFNIENNLETGDDDIVLV